MRQEIFTVPICAMAAMTAMINRNFMLLIDASRFDYSNDIKFGGQIPRIVGA